MIKGKTGKVKNFIEQHPRILIIPSVVLISSLIGFFSIKHIDAQDTGFKKFSQEESLNDISVFGYKYNIKENGRYNEIIKKNDDGDYIVYMKDKGGNILQEFSLTKAGIESIISTKFGYRGKINDNGIFKFD